MGILLVAGSVAGTVGLVSARDRTVPMYVAREDISFGEPVEASRLDVVDVRLDGTQEHYLPAEREPAAGTRASTLIRAGELVPLRGLGLDDGTTRKPVSVRLEQALPAAVVPGSRVDVWAAARDRSANAYGRPEILLPSAEVAAVSALESGFGGASGTVIELLVDDGRMADLLAALANEASVTVVHNPAGGGS
ncbi:hypothetical protein NCCP1664_28510 [Zafaria cholistanensis]|uniref:SAF domain-containing protein n=1 Tax=Zafaria cholistanensis TaxID=1682741 RepID=A0A5A7NUJ7_9MICC|nr:hypothetical protein NCCP1664_28510 [Zafaria cholistanensis]